MADTGRPTKYTEDMPQRLLDFFSSKEPFDVEVEEGRVKLRPNKLPTLERFAVEQRVHIDTLYEWGSKHPLFSEALRVCKCIQRDMLMQGGLSGAYKDTITKLILSTNHGMSEKVIQESTININSASDEELDKRIAALMAKANNVPEQD